MTDQAIYQKIAAALWQARAICLRAPGPEAWAAYSAVSEAQSLLNLLLAKADKEVA